MVCCVLISIILGCLIRPFRALTSSNHTRKKAIQWRLASQDYKLKQPSKFSLSARANSIRYALNGLSLVICSEHNARIHLIAAFSVVSLGLVFNLDYSDWPILLLAIMSVCITETINTAFEHLCDVVSPEKSESVRFAKDIAAGAVLIASIGAALIGIIVLMPYITA